MIALDVCGQPGSAVDLNCGMDLQTSGVPRGERRPEVWRGLSGKRNHVDAPTTEIRVDAPDLNVLAGGLNMVSLNVADRSPKQLGAGRRVGRVIGPG
jgi:hypothetical protein